MSEPGVQHAEQILDDLACPQCEYNLKGLRGPVVHCPECGLECDIPRMIANVWTRPWWDAPGFNRLVRPLSFLVLSGCGLFVVLMFETRGFRSAGPLSLCLGVVAVMIWACLLAAASNQFENGRGLELTAFVHLLFVGYLGGVVGFVLCIVGVFTSGQIALIILELLGAAGLVVLLYFCRKGERYVAEQCLKRHLARSA
jgi:hypothetical protein